MDLCKPQTRSELDQLEGHAHRLLNNAAAEGKMDRVCQLLDGGASVVAGNTADDQEGWTLLHHMIQGELFYGDERDKAVLKRVLRYPQVRAAIDQTTDNGETALYFAVHQKNLDDVCITLLEHGAKMDASTTPDFGAEFGNVKNSEWGVIIQYLWGYPQTAVWYAQHLSPNPVRAYETISHLFSGRVKQSQSTTENCDLVVRLCEAALGPTIVAQNASAETRGQLGQLCLQILPWIVQEQNTPPQSKEDWLEEKSTLAHRFLNVFEQAGATPWQPHSSDNATSRVRGLLNALNHHEMGAQLENLHLSHQSEQALAPIGRSPRL